MKTSESIKEITKAIQNVQQNAAPVKKGATGQVGTRAYQYANMVSTWDTIKDLLKSNNLVVIQSPTTGENYVAQLFQTTIYHTTSGEWISEQMTMVLQRDDPQGIGAAITYYRRYMLTSMLGLIPDDDNDAKDHRLATTEQKARMVGAVKQIYPELEKPNDIITTIENIIGKHPSKVREDEAENYINLIKAFTAKAVMETE